MKASQPLELGVASHTEQTLGVRGAFPPERRWIGKTRARARLAFRLAANELDDARVIELAVTARLEQVVERGRDGPDRGRGACLAGGLLKDLQVLEHQVGREPRLEATLGSAGRDQPRYRDIVAERPASARRGRH